MQGLQQPPLAPHNAASGGFQEFYRMNPPKFQGGFNLILYHDWLFGMERVFQVVPCNTKEKVTFSLHMMKGQFARW